MARSEQILVPVDGSEHAFRALKVACALAIAENVLNAARDQALADDVQSLECFVEHGDASKGILGVAGRESVESIVMGTRGLSDFQSMVLGSVAHKVMHAADCRVIVVK